MASSNNNKIYSRSLSYYAWQRLKKNRLAMFGLFMIGICSIISLLGYLITPDSTPDCNIQHPELNIKQPGFEVQMLKSKKNQESQAVGLFEKIIAGEASDYSYIPFYRWEFEDNDIIVEGYTGLKSNVGPKIRFNVADVIYAIDYNKPVVNDSLNSTMKFYQFGSSQLITKSINELRETVEREFIITKKYYLGTDRLGRDMLSRLMIGTRVSLFVGFVAVFISFIIGVFLGAVSGFFRGWVDDLIMWLINVIWSIPTLLLVIAITLALGKGLIQVFVAVGLTMWVDVARVVRGQTLSVREQEFVEAGRALGFNNLRLIFKHVLPNVMGPVIVICAANFANAILIEAGLSFLGIGGQPPTSSWGVMISEHRPYITTDAAYLAIIPGIAIMIMVLAFVLLGNGLRDAVDAKSIDNEPAMGY